MVICRVMTAHKKEVNDNHGRMKAYQAHQRIKVNVIPGAFERVTETDLEVRVNVNVEVMKTWLAIIYGR